MSTGYKWQRVDKLSRPYWLDPDDVCVFAREQTDTGYSGSETNQHVFNLKKPPKYRSANHWWYKGQAIKRFATELLDLLPNGAVIAPAATSKPRQHPDYDSRLDEVVQLVGQKRSDITVIRIIEAADAMLASHSEGGSRHPEHIIQNLKWVAESSTDIPKDLFLIDDVLTSGGHFKAYQRFIRRRWPDTRVIGVFWARHVSTEIDQLHGL